MYRQIWDPARKRAGLGDVTFYGLRHSYASILLEAGADVVAVSKLLGHADPTTTYRFYAHYLKDHAQQKRDVDGWFKRSPSFPHDDAEDEDSNTHEKGS